MECFSAGRPTIIFLVIIGIIKIRFFTGRLDVGWIDVGWLVWPVQCAHRGGEGGEGLACDPFRLLPLGQIGQGIERGLDLRWCGARRAERHGRRVAEAEDELAAREPCQRSKIERLHFRGMSRGGHRGQNGGQREEVSGGEGARAVG